MIDNFTGKWKSRLYTLIEVVISIGILALVFAAFMQISSAATMRVSKAFRQWNNSHRCIQAAEYFLLAGSSTSEIPQEIFPYNDTRVTVEISEPEGLPEGVESNRAGWKLVVFKISVFNDKGEILSTLPVEKILRDNDL